MEEESEPPTDMEIEFSQASKDGGTQISLLNMMKQNDGAFNLLKATGNFWPPEYEIQRDLKSWETFHVFYFIVCRITVILVIAFSMYYLAEEVQKQDLVGITISFTFFLDAISVLPTQILNQYRLQLSVFNHDSSVFDRCNRVSGRFFIVCIVSICVSINSGALLHQSNLYIVLLTLGELSVVLYLVFNMWFLMLDLNASSRLIDELIAQCDTHQLTLDRFNVVRSEIHTRVQNSKWASDFILIPCVASIAAILVLAFHLDPNWEGVVYAMGWVSAVMKEMVFICVAFVYVAEVNYKADLLTEKLSCTLWTTVADSTDSVLHHSQERSQQLDVDQESLITPSRDREVERLTMCVSSLTKPISFTLLFKRVSWQNVFVSAAGLVLTLSVGILRSIFVN
jgi:hypothetical protein